jgi:hypothetical protein
MGQNFRRQLVALLGSAPLRQQTRKPGRLERGMRLMSSRQRDPEQLRGHRDRHVLHAMAPHHLVAQLQQIAWIEEAAAAEHFNGLRPIQ